MISYKEYSRDFINFHSSLAYSDFKSFTVYNSCTEASKLIFFSASLDSALAIFSLSSRLLIFSSSLSYSLLF